MFRIVRTRTLRDLEAALLDLRERITAELGPGDGCCRCGALLCDVLTPMTRAYPIGETYCWRCVDQAGITAYTVFPGRERPAGRHRS